MYFHLLFKLYGVFSKVVPHKPFYGWVVIQAGSQDLFRKGTCGSDSTLFTLHKTSPIFGTQPSLSGAHYAPSVHAFCAAETAFQVNLVDQPIFTG
jgi:hypothetical protein